MCVLFLQLSLRRKYCDLRWSSSPLMSATSPAGSHGAASVLCMAFWWITDLLKMSTTEVAHRSTVMPVASLSFRSSCFLSSDHHQWLILTKLTEKNVQGFSLTNLHCSDIIWGNRENTVSSVCWGSLLRWYWQNSIDYYIFCLMDNVLKR